MKIGDKRLLTTLKSSLLSLVCIILGSFLLWLSEPTGILGGSHGVAAFLRELGAVVAAGGLFSVLWELFVKRLFVEELWSYARLTSDIGESGIKSFQLVENFQTAFEWGKLFSESKKFCFFFAYAETWRHSCEYLLRDLAKRDGVEIEFILPNPANEQIIAHLAHQFQMAIDDLKNKIVKAETELKSIFNDKKARFNITFVDTIPHFSFYRFENTLIVAFNKHATGRGNVMALRADREGWLWRYFEGEISALSAHAHK